MKEQEIQTSFGTVILATDDDNWWNFYSEECIVLATDSENDGPYFWNGRFDWDRLNTICQSLFDDDLYGVASDDDNLKAIHATPNVIDKTEEIDSRWAIVCKNTQELYISLVKAIKDQIRFDLGLWVDKNMHTEEDEYHAARILQMAEDAFEVMMDGHDFEEAAKRVALMYENEAATGFYSKEKCEQYIEKIEDKFVGVISSRILERDNKYFPIFNVLQ